jgi:hypothetical protein
MPIEARRHGVFSGLTGALGFGCGAAPARSLGAKNNHVGHARVTGG